MSPRIGLDESIIVDAAVGIANTEGVEAVTLATVAKKLGIRSPSLYNHIDGLLDLRNRIALYGLNELYQRLADSIGENEKAEAVYKLADAYLDFARTHPGIYDLTLAPDFHKKENRALGQKIVKLTATVFQSFNLTEEESIHAVRGIRSLLHGFASLEKHGGFGLPFSVDESFRKLIDAFLAGISTYKSG